MKGLLNDATQIQQVSTAQELETAAAQREQGVETAPALMQNEFGTAVTYQINKLRTSAAQAGETAACKEQGCYSTGTVDFSRFAARVLEIAVTWELLLQFRLNKGQGTLPRYLRHWKVRYWGQLQLRSSER